MTTLVMNSEDFRKVVEENRRLRQALEALTGSWLTWPAKKQPDPRVTLYESRTVKEIQEHAQKALDNN